VLLHGCGGMYERSGTLAPRYTELAARLRQMGVAALVLDSLTPRGETELCTQRNGQRQITQSNRRRDALGALQWLAAQPGIDATRLGLLGWSNGGSTVLAATNATHAEAQAATVKPSLAVAYYPGCASELARGYRPVAPLLLLVGEADDWTPAQPCKDLAAQAAAAPSEAAAPASAGAAARPGIQLHLYPGAFHGFDGTAALRLRRDVPNGSNPGQGVHVGSNPAARVASQQALEAFLRERWTLR
jgi:dienelactone hydrolase